MSFPNPLARWLEPQELSRVASLQWSAKNVVEGLRGGKHRSRNVGASVDFKEHRPYVHGDETRSIDWKLFGKTDRLYIRQYEDETNLRATLVVDQSGSMRYAGSRSGGVSKHEYAVRLSACLAYLFVAQQDAVGIATFDTRIRATVPPRSRPSHLRSIVQVLAQSECGGDTELDKVLQDLLGHCRRRGLVVLVSDCYGSLDGLERCLAMLRAHHLEVVIFQIVDDDECDFPFHSRTQFRSLESQDHQVLVDPLVLRSAYLENRERFQAELLGKCQTNRVDLITVRTSESFSSVLAGYLARRGPA